MSIILYPDNALSGHDFNHLGILTASIDEYGACIISDINTNDPHFHLNMDTSKSNLPYHFFFLIIGIYFLFQTI